MPDPAIFLCPVTNGIQAPHKSCTATGIIATAITLHGTSVANVKLFDERIEPYTDCIVASARRKKQSPESTPNFPERDQMHP
jgi:hypothetical protein